MSTADTEVSPPLFALFEESVDYAGLFPPAALALETALDHHAANLRSPDAWLLGCFVLPMAKLAEVGPLLAGRFTAEWPLQIAALMPQAGAADEHLDGLRAGLHALLDFQQIHGRTVSIEQLEMPLPSQPMSDAELDLPFENTAGLIEEACGAKRHLRIFWETPISSDLTPRLHRVAHHNKNTSRRFGVKLRTGGMQASAFPSPEQLAGALVAAYDARAALKFTAGLHHPFRWFDAGVNTRMHGFVNVYAAGVFLSRPGFDVPLVQALVEDEAPENFYFDADGIRWRNWEVTGEEVLDSRAFLTSFGSCSFDEPRDDLGAAGLFI